MREIEQILEELEEKKKKCLDIVKIEIDPMEITIHREQYKGLRMAEDIIRKHTNDGWIPVDERLPEIGEYVLGTNEYGEVLVYHYGWNSPHTRKMFFQLCGAAVNVAAWYPLPKPYSLERNS